MEKQLKQKLNRDDNFCLADYFDYIGGTSTGAIIAAGLPIGMSVQQLLDFYINKGKDMLDKNFILQRWNALYESDPLLKMLKETFGHYLIKEKVPHADPDFFADTNIS